MRKFLGALFRNESDEPPPETSVSNVPQVPRKIYGDDPTPDSEIVLKIVIIGGASSGKTSIVRRYLQACFTHQYIPTIGIDMSTAKLQSKSNPDAEYRIQFWDVSHAEVRGKHHKNIFRGAVGIVMVFDCCNVQSVSAVDEWRISYEDCLRTANTPRIPMILLANKSDVGPPVIKPADLDTYCERGGYAVWRLTSSRTGNSVIEALDKLLDISIEFRELQQASRKRRPEKLITSKSQLLSPQIRATNTNMPTNSLPNNHSNLATSIAQPSNFATSLTGTSSGNDNGYIPSSSSSSYSNNTPRSTASRKDFNPTTPPSSSSSTPRASLDARAPATRPTSIPVQNEPSVKSPESTNPPPSPENNNNNNNSNSNKTSTNNTTPSDTNNEIKTTETTTTTTTSETVPINKQLPNMNEHSDVSVSLDASIDLPTSDTLSDADTNPSSNASNTTSASASTHASQRNMSSMRSSTSMEFAFLDGESRPSILSITNALAVDDLKLGELVNIAEDFYSRLKSDLDQLFMNVKPSRKSDLQILEFQRFDEYVKLMDVLKAHKEKAQDESEGSGEIGVKKYPTDQLQILLSENMKKWNQLIMNLHTEVSLYKSGVFDESRSTNTSKLPTLKSSASDTMLYSRYENAPLPATSATTTSGSSPSKSKDNSALMTPPIGGADQGETKRQQQGTTRRMGFGFRNVGKNPSAIFQIVNPNPTSFSLDNDNVSSPPSPYNSVPSPSPSSPSTSPTSASPPNFLSRASLTPADSLSAASSVSDTPSSTLDSSFRLHMEPNGTTKTNKSLTTSATHAPRTHSQHGRSISLPTTPLPSLASHITQSSSTTPTPTTTPPLPEDTTKTPPRPSTPAHIESRSESHLVDTPTRLSDEGATG